MEIKHLSPEEMEAYRQEHPESEPKEWALFDKDVCFGFYNTEEEAMEARGEWNIRTMVEESFRDWAHTVTEVTGIELQKVLEIVKDSV